MAIDASSSLFEQILVWLVERQGREAASYNRSERTLVEAVAGDFPPFTSDLELRQLLKLAPRSGETSSQGSFLHLPLLSSHMRWLPVLTTRYDYDRDAVSIQIVLFGIDQELRAVGLRFESPERWWSTSSAARAAEAIPPRPGIHDFHHTQMIREVTTAAGRTVPIPAAAWTPVVQPSVPIDARTVPQLLITVVISLYGLRLVEELVQASFTDLLKPELRAMRLGAALPFGP
jgi:hypothetical protein